MNTLLSRAFEHLQKEGPISLVYSAKRFVYKKYVGRIEIIARYLLNKYRYDTVAHPYKVVQVSPLKIKKHAYPFGYTSSIARVERGRWDLDAKSLTEYPKYNAIRMRYEEGANWEETGIYDHLLSEIEQEGAKDGCQNLTDVKERYANIDKLYRSMKMEGYDLSYHDDPPPWWGSYNDDYIGIHIGRNGNLIYANGGWHRLSIAKVLELDQIPVCIRARHQKWQMRRDEVYNASSIKDLTDKTKQFLDHPDMQDVVSSELRST